MKKCGRYTELVDYIFWIVFILFNNPGGILKAFGENSGDGGINVTDILYVLLLVSFLLIFKFQLIKYDKSIKCYQKAARLNDKKAQEHLLKNGYSW